MSAKSRDGVAKSSDAAELAARFPARRNNWERPQQ